MAALFRLLLYTANTTSYQNTGLVSNTTYYYRLIADNSYGNSVYSNEANATTLAPDTTPPAQIITLQTSNPQLNSIDLTWRAPGDDGNSGQATQYDIRYFTASISDSNWANATQCQNEPVPAVAGGRQTFVVTGLQPGTQYYFAMKTRDEVNNWSSISNIAVGMTTPIPITVIQVTPSNDNISFTTQTGENRIRCIADIKPDSLDAQYNSQIEWEIDDTPGDGIDSGNPPDPERGNDVYLTLTAPTAPNGRPAPLSYRITASVRINFIKYTSGATYTTQDQRDQIRQEYIDVERNGQHASRVPNRSEFSNGGGSPHYSFNDLNSGDYTWAIVTQGLYNGLEATGAILRNYEDLSSGYRNPIHNVNTNPPGAINSWHIHGRAADIDGDTYAENQAIYNAARQTNPIEYIREPNNVYPTRVHVAW